MTSVSHTTHHPRKRHIVWGAFFSAVIASFAAVVVAGFLGLSYERAYAGRLYPGVTVLSISMGGKTYAEARALIDARAAAILDHQLSLVFSDGSVHKVTPRSLGLDLSTDDLLHNAYMRGRSADAVGRWSEIALLHSSGAAYAFTPDFSIATMMDHLEDELKSHERPMVDAKLKEQNGQFQITPAENGLSVDRAALASTFERMFRTLALPSSLDVPTTTIAPQVTEAMLMPITTEATRLTSAPITLAYADKTFVATSGVLFSWLSVEGENGAASLGWNTDEVNSFVAKSAKKIDLTMRPRKINEKTGAVLDEGAIGRKTDQALAVKEVLAVLETRKQAPSIEAVAAPTITLAVAELPITDKIVPPPFTPGLYEGKYVEVNLTEQRLYQFEGQNLIATYPVSSGKWTTPTPQGVLYIKNHIPYAYSRPFNLYMPWWLGLSFNQDGSNYQGFGIHELPEWKGGKKEGQNHLGTPVSHGCIRLGIGAAQAIYDWAIEGMPVYIHK